MRGRAPTVGLLALLQVVVAQQECLSLTSKFPECAFSCITSAGSAVGCTVATDVACRCTPASSQAIVQTALNCVLDGCPFSEVSNVIAAGSSVCACVATATSEPPQATTTDVSTSTSVPEETSTSVPEEPSASTSQQTTTEEPPPTTATSEQPVTTTPPPQVTCTPDSPCQESADAVPECAQSCISSAAADAAGCREGDYGCSCASQAVILPAAQGCVIDGCGIPGALQVLSSVSALCDCVTASPTTPCDGGEPTATTSGGGDDDDDEETTTTAEETTTTSPPDSETTEPPPETTCEGATTSDCGPVASTAIPQCAQACFASAVPNVGCGVDDFGCQCQEEAQASLSQLLIPCVATACDSGDLPGVITGAASVCACATAPPSGGNCPTETNSPPPPPTDTTTTTRSGGGDGEPTTTCAQATTPDCGPVATSVIPDCAQPCFAEGAPGVGCDAEDYGCQCEPDALASLSAILVPCVATACPPASIPLVIAGASSVCQCAQAGPTGGCPGDGGSGGGEPTTKPPAPTKTDGNGAPEPTTTCAPGEPADCGAVATSALPSCAQACFSSAAPGVGCDATDFGCQCEPAARESLSQLLIPCVATACDSGDLPAVITGAESVCACATAAPTGGDCPAPTGGNGGGGGSGGGGGNGGGNGGGSGGNGDGSNGGGSGGDGDGSSGGGDGSSGGGDGSNGGGDGSGGNGGGDEDGDGPLVIPPSSGGRLEVGFVAGVFGAVWLLAVAL